MVVSLLAFNFVRISNFNNNNNLSYKKEIMSIPEGLAIGVAFGAAAAGLPAASIAGAIALAIGIGIQNFPEGAAVSVPLRREGFSRTKFPCLGPEQLLLDF